MIFVCRLLQFALSSSLHNSTTRRRSVSSRSRRCRLSSSRTDASPNATRSVAAVLALRGLVPQPRRGPVDDVLIGMERGPAGALIVIGHGVPLGGRSGPLGGKPEPVQGTCGNTINTAAEKLIICSTTTTELG